MLPNLSMSSDVPMMSGLPLLSGLRMLLHPRASGLQRPFQAVAPVTVLIPRLQAEDDREFRRAVRASLRVSLVKHLRPGDRTFVTPESRCRLYNRPRADLTSPLVRWTCKHFFVYLTYVSAENRRKSFNAVLGQKTTVFDLAGSNKPGLQRSKQRMPTQGSRPLSTSVRRNTTGNRATAIQRKINSRSTTSPRKDKGKAPHRPMPGMSDNL